MRNWQALGLLGIGLIALSGIAAVLCDALVDTSEKVPDIGIWFVALEIGGALGGAIAIASAAVSYLDRYR